MGYFEIQWSYLDIEQKKGYLGLIGLDCLFDL